MIIEDIDALQNWLTQTLSPVCDADPQALAKYVIALVKKDKPEEELKSVCSDQLDVFLQEKTKEFVEKLFVALGNNSYITPKTRPPKPAAPPPPPPPAAPLVPKPPREPVDKDVRNPEPDHRAGKPNDDLVRRKSRSRSPGRRSPGARSPGARSPGGRSPRRSPGRDGPRDLRRFINQRRAGGDRRGPTRYGRSRHSPGPRRRTRSRSRSPRPRRSRSPGARPRSRSPNRSRSLTPGGRKRSPRPRSPGRSRSPRRSRSRSLRRSRSPRRRSPNRRSPNRRSPNRARSPNRPRSRSPGRFIRRSPNRYQRSPNRSRSRERFRDGPPRNRGSKSWSRSLSPFSDSLSGGSRSRSRHRSRSRPRSKSKSPVRRPSTDSRGSTPLNDSPRYNRLVAPGGPFKSRVRCRDFDVQGFCMQGDLCPYDHGIDPVVVDDVNLSTVLPFTNQVPPPGSAMPPVVPGARPPGPPQMDQVPPGLPAPGPRHPPPPGAPPQGPVHQRLGPLPPHNRDGPSRSPPPPPGTAPVQQQPPPVSTCPPMPMHGGPPPHFMHPGPNRPPGPWNPSLRPPMMGHGPPRPAWQPQGPPPPHSGAVANNGQPPIPQMEIKVEDKTVSRTVLPAGTKRPFQDGGGGGYYGRGGPPAKRGAYDNSRGRGGRRPFNPTYADNATLELRRVPPELNNIMAINNHFSKFGNLTNVQVCYKGETDAALITFSSHSEATAAYKSPEPVLNNRFVKVFWHRKDEENSEATTTDSNQTSATSTSTTTTTARGVEVSMVAGMEDRRPSIKERLGIPPAHKLSLNNTKPAPTSKPEGDTGTQIVVSPTGGLTKTVLNPTALGKTDVTSSTTAPIPAAKPQVIDYQARRKDYKARQVLKRNVELNRQKQVLLTKQLEQQKILLMKLDGNKNMPAKDRETIIRTIKVLATSTAKLKKEITEFNQNAKKQAAASQAALSISVPNKPEAAKVTSPSADPQEGFQTILNETKKAILDTELDLISKKTSGADTSELRKKVAELKKEAHSLGLIGRGRGGFLSSRGRGRGRGGLSALDMGGHSLDKRPRELLVSGFELADKDEVIAHMSTFGEVSNIVPDDSAPSVIITYATRQQAERAVREGYTFKSKHLMMAWHTPSKPRTPTTPKTPSLPSGSPAAVLRSLSGEGGAGGDGVIEEEEDDDGLEETRDDDPLEGEDLVGGPGTYVMEDNDELDEEVDEDVLLGLDDDEEEDNSHAWKR